MLNRVFKTILVLSICVGITLPTNAAVSVSDGSAFVTKSEFSSNLNNLTNRMAQLENSLDAKIDSLVSSYLTRNGIWNGAKQEVLLVKDDILPKKVTSSNYQAVVNDTLASGTYIDSLNKSGMFVCTYSYRNKNGVNDNRTRWGYSGNMRNEDNHCSDNGLFLTLNMFEKSGSITNQKYSSVFLSTLGWPAARGTILTYNLYFGLPTSEVYGNVLFFVSKGNEIQYEVREIAHFYNVASITRSEYEHRTMVFCLNDDACVY